MSDKVIEELARIMVEERRTLIKYMTKNELKEMIKETVKEVLSELKFPRDVYPENKPLEVIGKTYTPCIDLDEIRCR